MLKKKRIHKIIRENSGDQEAIKAKILALAENPARLIDNIPSIQACFTASEIKAIIDEAFLNDDDTLIALNNITTIKGYYNNEKLRDILQKFYQKSPWYFFIQYENFRELFTDDYFDTKLKENKDLINDKYFRNLYKFHSRDYSADIHNESVIKYLKPVPREDILVGERKEAGFGCGGMEKNFYESVKQGRGICLINGNILAKKFHRKGADKSKKISFIVEKNYISKNGIPIFADMIYAPSEGTAKIIEEALENGKKEITIESLSLRASRPLISTTSEGLFELYREKKSEA